MKRSGKAYLTEKWHVSDIHSKSIFFHPEMKRMRAIDERDREMVLEAIRVELRALEKDENTMVELNVNAKRESSEPACSSQTKKRKKTLVDQFKDDVVNEAQDEVQSYLQSSFSTDVNAELDVLQWWEQNRERFPNIYTLSLRYLCVPATNAVAEGKFCLSKYLISEKRTNLKARNVNDLMFLKSYFDNN